MGDALAVQERDLMDLGEPGPSMHRLLKAGHHGSRNASDPAWIAALKPEVAIISAGFRNPFEHPHLETLETFRREGLTPWMTGASCGVRVSAATGGWGIETGDGAVAFTPLRRDLKP
jgi:competence protein ComEC